MMMRFIENGLLKKVTDVVNKKDGLYLYNGDKLVVRLTPAEAKSFERDSVLYFIKGKRITKKKVAIVKHRVEKLPDPEGLRMSQSLMDARQARWARNSGQADQQRMAIRNGHTNLRLVTGNF